MSGCHIPIDDDEKNVSPLVEQIQKLNQRLDNLEIILKKLTLKQTQCFACEGKGFIWR